jgi:hypothetical protein
VYQHESINSCCLQETLSVVVELCENVCAPCPCFAQLVTHGSGSASRGTCRGDGRPIPLARSACIFPTSPCIVQHCAGDQRTQARKRGAQGGLHVSLTKTSPKICCDDVHGAAAALLHHIIVVHKLCPTGRCAVAQPPSRSDAVLKVHHLASGKSACSRSSS